MKELAIDMLMDLDTDKILKSVADGYRGDLSCLDIVSDAGVSSKVVRVDDADVEL